MHNRSIDDVAEHWDISYFPTFAVLTFASVPDQASTFVLLTFSHQARLVSANRRFEFQTRGQRIIGAHDETLSVAMRVHNPDRSPFTI
jgi:hypothetical protein